MDQWTFLTNHAHVLLAIDEDPEIRMRDAAEKVGITERAAQRILADLLEAGYVTREKVGRRNRYTVHRETPLRHRLASHQPVGLLLDLLAGRNTPPVKKRRRRRPAVKRALKRS